MTLAPVLPIAIDIEIDQFLRSEGFVGSATARAREVLEAANLTRPGKRRIAVSKLDRVRQTLGDRLIRVCHRTACRNVVDSREHIAVPTQACEVCGGSPNRRAGQLARQAMLAAGYHRVLVVGGTPNTHAALVESLASNQLELRCVDGKQGSRSSITVEADLDWADVLLIWATTPLPHKVSRLYTSRAPGRLPSITVPRRGVEAVCEELIRFGTAATA